MMSPAGSYLRTTRYVSSGSKGADTLGALISREIPMEIRMFMSEKGRSSTEFAAAANGRS
jgi:hypothetical protein